MILKRIAGGMLVALLAGCSSHPGMGEMGEEQAYNHYRAKYDKGDFYAAAEGFDQFTLNYSGSALVDSAQFMLAMSKFKLKEHLVAAAAFDELSRRFPRSPLVPEAMFMVGVCYWKASPKYQLDQEDTQRSLQAFQSFIDYYPEAADKVREAEGYIAQCREKLAHKEFASGVIYLKMKDWLAAQLYFQKVLDLYYDTEWAPAAAFNLGRSLAGGGRLAAAAEAYRNYLAKYPGHQWSDRARTALHEIEGRDNDPEG